MKITKSQLKKLIKEEIDIAALLAIIVAKARKRDRYGPEEMDIYGKVTNDN